MVTLHIEHVEPEGLTGVDLASAVAVCQQILNQDRSFCEQVGQSTVNVKAIALTAVPGEDPTTMGERLARLVKADALRSLAEAERELLEVTAVQVKQELAKTGGAAPIGFFQRLGRGALRLFRGKNATILRAAQEAEELAAHQAMLERAAGAKRAAQDRFTAATGFGPDELRAMIAAQGAPAVLDQVSDKIIANPKFGASYEAFRADPVGFYKKNGAAVTDRVLRLELARASNRSVQSLTPEEIEAWTAQHGFASVTHLAGGWTPDMVSTGTMMSGSHSGGYTWFGMGRVTDPTWRQKMSTTIGPAAFGLIKTLNQAVPLAIPQKDVLHPGEALETGGTGVMNRAAYKVKGAVQQGYAKGLMGFAGGAHQGAIRLLPESVALSQDEIGALQPSLGGGVNSGDNRRRQLITLAILGAVLGAALLL
jgi:hypothetical protein